MRRNCLLSAMAAAMLFVGACDWAPANDKVFGERVRAYLLAHPEVLQEVAQKYQEKQLADQAAVERRARLELPKLRAQVERDPRDYVANPDGKVTVTEFYDYRCPHCVNIAPEVLALIKDNPDVRFVFKEMPIFGPRSEHAARAALAVKKAGGDYIGFHRTLMEAQSPESDYDALALAHGARPADLASPAVKAAAKRQLADTEALFSQLALGGTPAFIIGDNIIAGEDMPAVRAAISKAGGVVKSVLPPAA